MPYCTQCGDQVSGADVYCGHCGARQHAATAGGPGNTPPAPGADPLGGLSGRTASILCYVPAVGWIAAVIVLAAHKFRGDRAARFHAFQGLYLFAAWLAVSWIVRPMVASLPEHFVRIDHILETIILGVSIFMMVKASHGEAYVLPLIGELAQRSAIEQQP
jgi:uncharacterized membrane protein